MVGAVATEDTYHLAGIRFELSQRAAWRVPQRSERQETPASSGFE
jgi:hypothetical protein